MSDFNTPPNPPEPTRQRTDAATLVIVGLLAAIVALLIAFFAMRGGDSAAPATTLAAAPAETVPVTAAQTNKYDAYYQHVLNNSGKANSMSKSDVIEFGDLVCQTLDSGYPVSRVVSVLADASSTTSDQELSAAVMYGAIVNLCPEYKADLSAYLGN